MLPNIDDTLLKGVAAHRAGNLQEAQRLYNLVLQIKPMHADANNNMALLAVGVGNFSASLNFFKKALSAQPNNVQFMLNYAQALLSLNMLKEAQGLVKKAEKKGAKGQLFNTLKLQLSGKAPLDPPLEDQKRLISVFASKDYNGVLQRLEKFMGDFPKSALLHNLAGASHAALKNYKRAINCYQDSLKVDPKNAETHYNMAAALNDSEDHVRAEKSYKKAIALRPKYEDAIRNLGSLLSERGRYSEAIECFDQLSDKYAVAKALECHYFLENYDEFNQRITNIAKVNPSNIRVAAMSAFASHQLKQPDIYPFCRQPNEFVKVSHLKNHIDNHDEFVDDLLVEMNQKDTAWEPQNHATVAGFHTFGNLFATPSKALEVLESAVRKELDLYFDTFKDVNNGLINNWPTQKVVKSWYVRMLKNGHQTSHIHSAGCVSGVIYLKTVDNPIGHEGALEFGLHGYGYPTLDDNLPRQFFQPKKGDIVLFPSSLFHATVPVVKDTERCVIAFDLHK